ncbi:MAG: two pore domain potassium channel family protein [Acidobacteriota bacterium]|nr:MAG: two pore domain potassium channel family protein [Acidobacteriota bacterium]
MMANDTATSPFLGRLKGDYAFLLVTLLSVFAIIPFLGSRPGIRWLLIAAVTLVLLASLVSIWEWRRLAIVTLAFGLISQILASISLGGGFRTAGTAGNALQLVFLVMITGSIFAGIMRSQRVTMNTVFGAVCVYLLMVICWASAFSLLEWVEPGSFSLEAWNDPSGATGPRGTDLQLTYFSLITLTTIGYGDITPLSPPARILAGLEGLIGQLYLAIIIARLVSMEIAARMSRSSERR